MRIGLVPMSAKPYHAGHHHLVKSASLTNDEVFVFVSLSDRIKKNEFPIEGSKMEKIWIDELLSIMPENVSIIFGGSPVRKVYEYIQNEDSRENTITVYSDIVDTRRNYSESARLKYMEPLYSKGLIKFASEEFPENFTRGGDAPDISGTKMREYLLKGKKDLFIGNLPEGVRGENIWNILTFLTEEKKEEPKAPLIPTSF